MMKCGRVINYNIGNKNRVLVDEINGQLTNLNKVKITVIILTLIEIKVFSDIKRLYRKPVPIRQICRGFDSQFR